MTIFMRNVNTFRVYIFDRNVYARRKQHLELVRGHFEDGKFIEEKLPTAAASGIPTEPSADVQALKERIVQLERKLAGAKGVETEEVHPVEGSEEVSPAAAGDSAKDPVEKKSQVSAEAQKDNGFTPEVLKSELESRGLSQRQFAQRLDCSQSYLSKILRNAKPMPEWMALKSHDLLATWD